MSFERMQAYQICLPRKCVIIIVVIITTTTTTT
jgi:hypothetical protein